MFLQLDFVFTTDYNNRYTEGHPSTWQFTGCPSLPQLEAKSMLSIFQPEVTALESQIAQLQAQIVATQERIASLGEAESTAVGAIQAVQDAVKKIAGLAPDALGNLKAAVFALFNSCDASRDGGQSITPTQEPELDGQSTQLCCPLEDAPIESLQGQSVEVACLIGHPDLCEGQLLSVPRGRQTVRSDDRGLPCATVSAEEEEPTEPAYVGLVRVSDNVSYMRRLDGEIICCYLGLNSKQKAKQWSDWLTLTHSVATKCEARPAKRLTAFKYELKLWGMTIQQIERLASCDASKDPRSTYPDALKKQPESAPKFLQIDNIGVGDTVQSTTVRHWKYKITEINPDGFYVCDLIGSNPVFTQRLHPGSVELVVKADHLEQQAQEAIASIMPPVAPALAYSLIEADNLCQRWGVTRTMADGKREFAGSVSCGIDTTRWSHSRQPKYGQNIPSFLTKEQAAAALVKTFDRDNSPHPLSLAAAGATTEPDF